METNITKLLAVYPAWKHENDTLVGEWKFSNFTELQLMIRQLCDLAEELNHHPTVTFGYNTLQVQTTTHDAGNKVTDKDVELARRLSLLVGE